MNETGMGLILVEEKSIRHLCVMDFAKLVDADFEMTQVEPEHRSEDEIGEIRPQPQQEREQD